MRRLRRSVCGWLAVAVLASCEAGVPEYDGSPTVSQPELATITPGVQVVEFASDPVFFVDGFYWLYRDGGWSRSGSYRRAFTPIDRTSVPDVLLRLPRPDLYAHYTR